MNRLLTFVFVLSIVGWTYSCLKMKALQHRVIKETQDKLHYEKIFMDTEIFIDSLKNEIEDLKNKIDDLAPAITVKATMYHPVEAQCDDTPLITADGSRICPINVSDWNWVAVSQDLLVRNGGFLNYGDKVYIKGTHKDGIYTVRDCMNKRKTFQIDILESIGTSQYKYDEIELYALN
jgi:3D (Asp-Asp-Asp) domain-containing protein